jgi:hypothetical protein
MSVVDNIAATRLIEGIRRESDRLAIIARRARFRRAVRAE